MRIYHVPHDLTLSNNIRIMIRIRLQGAKQRAVRRLALGYSKQEGKRGGTREALRAYLKPISCMQYIERELAVAEVLSERAGHRWTRFNL